MTIDHLPYFAFIPAATHILLAPQAPDLHQASVRQVEPLGRCFRHLPAPLKAPPLVRAQYWSFLQSESPMHSTHLRLIPHLGLLPRQSLSLLQPRHHLRSLKKLYYDSVVLLCNRHNSYMILTFYGGDFIVVASGKPAVFAPGLLCTE